MYGAESAPPRWKQCENYVTGQMGMAVGQKFVKQEFDETAKDSVSFICLSKYISQGCMTLSVAFAFHWERIIPC